MLDEPSLLWFCIKFIYFYRALYNLYLNMGNLLYNNVITALASATGNEKRTEKETTKMD